MVFLFYKNFFSSAYLKVVVSGLTVDPSESIKFPIEINLENVKNFNKYQNLTILLRSRFGSINDPRDTEVEKSGDDYTKMINSRYSEINSNLERLRNSYDHSKKGSLRKIIMSKSITSEKGQFWNQFLRK